MTEKKVPAKLSMFRRRIMIGGRKKAGKSIAAAKMTCGTRRRFPISHAIKTNIKLMPLEDEVWKLGFGVSKSMRYHAYRRSFFDRIDHLNSVLVLSAGVCVAFALGAKRPDIEEVLAFALAALAIFDIVLKWGHRARTHDLLYREFSSLAREIASVQGPSARAVAVWKARRLEIETEEPSTMDWLEKTCACEEALARGVKPHPASELPWLKRALSQWISKWPWE